MYERFAQQADDGRDNIDLSGNRVTAAPVAFLDARSEQQQRYVKSQQTDVGQLATQAEAVVTDNDEQCFIEPGRSGCLCEELAKRPVRVALRSEVLIEITETADRFDRQSFGQGIRCVVGERLQDRVEGLICIQPVQFLKRAVEHVFI